MKVSFAADLGIARFLWERLEVDFSHANLHGPNWFCAAAFNDDGRMIAAAVAEFKTDFDAHFTCALDHPSVMTRRLLKAVFTALYSRAVRVTALIEPTNVASLEFARRVGFKREGYMRLAIEGKRDAIVLGMLRKECLVLNPGVSRETLKLIKGGRHGV